MEAAGVDAMFVPPSSDLEYLTGVARDVPSFGQSSYAHGWVAGAFVAPGREPLYVLPRMVLAFHLWGEEPGETVVVNEADDGEALFARAAQSFGSPARVGIGARTWGESVLQLQRALPQAELVNGTPLVNELRRVKSELELELMAHACSIADAAMAATAPRVQPGVTTIELSEEVEHQLRAHDDYLQMALAVRAGRHVDETLKPLEFLFAYFHEVATGSGTCLTFSQHPDE